MATTQGRWRSGWWGVIILCMLLAGVTGRTQPTLVQPSALQFDSTRTTVCYYVHNGELYAGAAYTGHQPNPLAKWTGSGWQPLGGPEAVSVKSITSYNGVLTVGGYFNFPGQTGYRYIVTFDGAGFVPFPADMDGSVDALADFHGDLIAGGYFKIGSTWENYVVKWDGVSWTTLGGTFSGMVSALTVYGDELFVGGDFGVRRWDGSQWQMVGTEFRGSVACFAEIAGRLIAGGRITFADQCVGRVAAWDGLSWSGLGSPLIGPIFTMEAFAGGLVVAGYISSPSDPTLTQVVHWDGMNWRDVPASEAFAYDYIEAVKVFDNRLFLGGYFIRQPGSHWMGGTGVWDGPPVNPPSGTTIEWPSSPIADQCDTCCVGEVGDVNCDTSVDIGDLTRLIDNLFGSFSPLCCEQEANCDVTGGIDIGDLTELIYNLFISFTPLPNCQ